MTNPIRGVEVSASAPTALLLYSGGIDSVWALYKRVKAGLATHVHHVRLTNWEGRGPLEKGAVNATLDWFRRRGYGHLITYTESGFDYGTLRYVVRDHNIWGLVAGIVLANPRTESVTELVRTFHRDSTKGGLDSAHGRQAELAWRTPVERLAGRDIEFTYPMLHLTKGEIIAGLPKSLLDLCWYCRRPQRGNPCHECHTCRQVDAALAGSPLPPLAPPPGVSSDVVPVERPRGNASRDEWARFAESVGVEVDDSMTRNEIRGLIQ